MAITWFFFEILFIFSETLDAIWPLKPLSTSSKIRVKFLSLLADNDLIMRSNLDNSPPDATFFIELNGETRIDEIASLISGTKITETAKKVASDLLQN